MEEAEEAMVNLIMEEEAVMINDWIECPATDMDRGASRLHPPLPDILPIAMEQILQLYKSVPNFSSSIKGADCGFQIVDEENGSALWMLGMDGLGMGMAKDYPIRHNRRSPPSQLANADGGMPSATCNV
jgi:hypothetical protein